MCEARLHRAYTAIQLDFGAGHETAFVAGEIDHRVRDVVGLADELQRDLARELVHQHILVELVRARGAIEDRRVHKGGVDRVTAELHLLFRAMQRDGF